MEPELEEWYAENRREYQAELLADLIAGLTEDEDDEEDWECPTCGRRSCEGYCPV